MNDHRVTIRELADDRGITIESCHDIFRLCFECEARDSKIVPNIVEFLTKTQAKGNCLGVTKYSQWSRRITEMSTYRSKRQEGVLTISATSFVRSNPKKTAGFGAKIVRGFYITIMQLLTAHCLFENFWPKKIYLNIQQTWLRFFLKKLSFYKS